MTEKTESILIVDDVSKNIQILGNILSQEDFQIAYAQSGKQALNICNHQSFDIILLDIMMPGMDGFEVCKELKNNPKTAEIPVIFLTAKADLDSIIKGFEIGGQDYITKPFNSAELLARVNNHLLIRRQKEKLKNINIELEKRVKERTLELEQANHQLAVLDLAKSNFLSVISHEVRTPLNGVIGLTELLSQTEIDDAQKEYLQNLQKVSKRLVRFSETAILITSLKIDKYHPEIMAVSVKGLLNDAIHEFNSSDPESEIMIKLDLPEHDYLIYADSDLIRSCFVRIIENTLRFAGRNSELDISVNTNEDRLVTTFTDNGPGFNKNALNNLFDLFSSGDILHNEGTGLGLAATKLALDANEATIEVMNSENGGAVVKINFKYMKER